MNDRIQEWAYIHRPRARAIMGTGLGAQVALYAALLHPHVFGKVAVQSLGLLPPVGDEVLSLVRGQKKQPIQFYVGWGRYDPRGTEYIDFDLRRDSRNFADLLKERGYTFTGSETAEGPARWGSRTDKILEAFFPLKAKN